MSTHEPSDSATAGDEDEAAGKDEPTGVFGNLPRTRPGARSTMRESESKRPAQPAAKGAEARSAGAPPASEPPPPPPGEAEGAERATGPGQPSAGGGIEDVAWAGVAAAAEAATIGVRLATRALEAMRDAVDRN